MYNQHVIEYYDLLCRFAAFQHRPMAQLHWYTQCELEKDPKWSPYDATSN